MASMSGISENCRLGFLQTECIIRVRDSIEKRKGKPWWHWQKIWIRLTVPSALCGDAYRYFWYPFPDVLEAFLLPWKDLGQPQMAFLWFSWASLYEIEIRWQGKTLVLKDCAFFYVKQLKKCLVQGYVHDTLIGVWLKRKRWPLSFAAWK